MLWVWVGGWVGVGVGVQTWLIICEKYIMSPLPGNGEQLVAARKSFKEIALKCHKEYNIKTRQDLLKAKSDNVKKYWKIPKWNKSLNFSTIYTNEFKEYFCSLLNPDDIFYEADEDIKHFLSNSSDEEVVRIFDIMNINISMEELEKAIS